MDPERKIEKWLRAYAKKRRGQTGDSFKIHPAARRLLQSEISRNAPKAQDDDEAIPLWQAIKQMWAFLLGFAACVFLLAAIFFQSLIHSEKKAEFASNKALTSPTNQNPSRIALGTISTQQLAENDLRMQRAAASGAASPASGGVFYRLMTPAPEGATRAMAPPVKSTGLEEDAFKNSSPASETSPILMNFQLQKDGNTIRVVDADGSVYSGSLASIASDTLSAETPPSGSAQDRSIANEPMQTMETAKTGIASPAKTSQVNQTAEVYSFQVNGINRTLHQNIEFTGSLLMQSQTTNTYSPLSVSGTVIINQTNQIEINAAQLLPAKN